MTYRSTDDTDVARRRRWTFLAFWGVVVVVALAAFRAVLVPFVLAALLAFVLSPLVRRLASVPVGGRRAPRWAAVLAIYVVLLGGLYTTVRVGAPFIIGEARDFLREEVPHLRDEARAKWVPRLRSWGERFMTPGAHPPPPSVSDGDDAADDHAVRIEPVPAGGYRVVLPSGGVVFEHESGDRYRLVPARATTDARHPRAESLLDRVRSLGAGHTEDIVRVGRGIIGGVVGGIFGFFIMLMLSAYMLVTEAQIFAFLRSLVHPASRPAFDELLGRIDRGLAGVVRGQLIICAVNGVLSAVGFGLAGLPYWPLLALLAAAFSIVPIFGSILSSVPAVAVGLRLGLPTALFTLAWILGIHQLEANLLNPKIMGDAAKINPVLVVFSLLVGEHFFGILGALLAVPAMSIVQNVFLHWRKYALNYGDAARPSDPTPPPTTG